MSTTRDVLAVVEADGQGRPKRLGLELASKAVELAAQAGGRAVGVVFGPRSAAEALGAYGLSRVYVCTDPRCQEELIGPPAAVLSSLIEQHNPWLVLMPGSPLGKDWAGRVVGKLGLGVEANVADLRIVDGKAQVMIPVFSGALRVSSSFTTDGEKPGIVIVTPGSFDIKRTEGTAQVEEVPIPEGVPTQVLVVERKPVQGGVPNLAEAQVIVAGGRGLAGPDNIQLIRELADILGGAVAATRAIVDAGWIPYAYQVGQTGKTVKPKLYIAVGISGEIQHKVGMQTSGTIIAINNNREAPIMQFADLAVVGDLFKLMPALNAELARRKQE
ncbi:MAG: electron transfer flavoprotein subunit alpha/FixB family protein [Chloroflexia bacterium]